MPGLNPLDFRADMACDLDRVNATLQASAVADDEFMTEIASHLIPNRGKRLRPSFVLASALIGASDPLAAPAVTDDMVRAGASVELVHLGSLYHDDVMDDAETRHGVEAVNHRWGNLKAILAGDFLMARASEIAASLGTEVAALLAATIGRLCEGQVRELRRMFDTSRSEKQYLEAISGKTAALYAASCRIGGLVGRLARDDIDRLTEFGHAYGMAFQIVDDILDLVATSEQLGKPSGNDMVAGVYTLPVIRLLATADDEDLRSLLGAPLDHTERQRARGLVLDSGIISTSIDTAVDYTDAAIALLAPLGDTTPVQGLRGAAKNLLASLPE